MNSIAREVVIDTLWRQGRSELFIRCKSPIFAVFRPSMRLCEGGEVWIGPRTSLPPSSISSAMWHLLVSVMNLCGRPRSAPYLRPRASVAQLKPCSSLVRSISKEVSPLSSTGEGIRVLGRLLHFTKIQKITEMCQPSGF